MSGGHESIVSPASTPEHHLTRSELDEMGRALRDKCSRQEHAAWEPSPRRDSPIHLLEASNKGRLQELIGIRYGRMLQSPFTFYRGAALNMAADLAQTPTTGIRVQACGDAHLCNFGGYATPERRLIFDINDLDETLPAPWEWDVKRLAASFVVASRNNGHSEEEAREAAQTCVRSYRENMAEFAEMRVLDVWYSSIDVNEVLDMVDDKDVRKRIEKRVSKAREHDVMEHDFPELVSTESGLPAIKDSPPLIFHWRQTSESPELIQKAFASYRESLPEHRRLLLDRYKLTDMAIKVVGVGSVGTVCAIMLLMADGNDPLFLQIKEARASVLEPFAGKSSYTNHGQRVVIGCQLMQSASDLFLGWTEGRDQRQFYIRQLKDMKLKPLVEIFDNSIMKGYAVLCGKTLAHAHARSGEPAMISGYLGKSDKFDEAIADFSVAYADQNEDDYATFKKAVQAGDIEVTLEEP